MSPASNPFRHALRALIQGVYVGDEKLTRVAMRLMALRTGAPGPIHPKNVLHSRSEKTWFEPYLPKEGGRVLDIGAGTGALSMLAATRGAEVVALEGDSRNIELMNSLRAKLARPELFRPVRHDLERLPYPIESASFDVVLSHDVIEHLHHRVEHLAEAARALKPGGILVIAGPNRDTTWKRVRGSVGLSTLADSDHKIEYTRDEFLEELRKAGFTSIRYESTTVIDAPINGLIELSAPASLALYERLLELKSWLSRKLPGETTGFRLILEKGP